MSDQRQNIQLELAFQDESRSEAPRGIQGRDRIVRGEARDRKSGLGEMTVQQLPAYLKQHWPTIREQLLSGTCVPQPVKRVEIPQAGRRSAQARHSDGAGSIHPASGDASSAAQVGPDVL